MSLFRIESERQKAEEVKKEEEEKRRREEKERREHVRGIVLLIFFSRTPNKVHSHIISIFQASNVLQEEYLALKASFAIEEEGYDDNVDESNEENWLLTFINYIKVHLLVNFLWQLNGLEQAQ